MLLACNRRTVLGAGLGLSLLAAHPAPSRAAEPRWRLLSDGDGPAARWDHTLAADDQAKQLILFGGRDATGNAMSDTWLYSLSERAWRGVDGPGPSPRFGHAVAVDQEQRVLLLFGGQSAEGFFNDAWRFDFASGRWSAIETGGPALPAPRYGLGAVLDDEGRLLISHGFTFEGRFDDTWALDPDTGDWTELSPGAEGVRPLRRCLHELVWDRDDRRLLLYGGCSSGYGPCPQGDLWAFDPAERVWTDLTATDAPAPRSSPALVVDPKAGRALLIGGLTDAGYASDVWALDLRAGVAWTPLPTSGDGPAARASHDAVLTRGDLYLFGGTDDTVFADLWKLSLT